MRLFLISFLLWTVTACKKDSTTTIEAFVVNTTTHVVKINFINANSVANSITLTPGKTVQIANDWEFGDVPRGGFHSEYFANCDSVEVLFDANYRMVHFFEAPPIRSAKHYLNNSVRNIANPNSYEFVAVRDGVRKNTFTYTFTEQDYLDAK